MARLKTGAVEGTEADEGAETDGNTWGSIVRGQAIRRSNSSATSSPSVPSVGKPRTTGCHLSGVISAGQVLPALLKCWMWLALAPARFLLSPRNVL